MRQCNQTLPAKRFLLARKGEKTSIVWRPCGRMEGITASDYWKTNCKKLSVQRIEPELCRSADKSCANHG